MTDHLNVLVTGCSDGGLGSALALALANHSNPPCTVIATLRNPSKATSLTSHERITVLPLDITSRESTESLVSELTRRGVDLDVVVCNAGVHYPGPLLDADIDADVADGHGIAQDAFDANVWGYLRTVKAVVPEMARRAKGGLVVTIGSCAEIVPSPFAGVYTASKAAMHALAETLGLELEPFGIQTILVKPGAVISNIANNGQHNLPLALRPTPPPHVPPTLYGSYMPAILGRLTRSQTDPSAITSAHAAGMIVDRMFDGYRPPGAGVSWLESVRAAIGMASRPDRTKRRFRGGVMLVGRLARLFWMLRLALPREMGLRFVARSIFGKKPMEVSGKKVE